MRLARAGILVRNPGIVTLTIVLTAILAACGSPRANKAPSRIAMLHPKIIENPTGHPDAWYRPDPIRVKVGQMVIWTNKDSDPHDVTARNGTFVSGPIPAGGTYRWVARKPGTYRYFCTLHPEMHGEIIVRA